MKEGAKTLKTGVDGKRQDIFEIRVTIQFPHSRAIIYYKYIGILTNIFLKFYNFFFS